MTVVAGLALTLAGCGSSGTAHGTGAGQPSAASLIAAMKSAFRSAKSVRMSGSLTVQGQSAKLDLGLLRSGDASGTITLGTTALRVLLVDGSAYAYVSKAYFTYLGQSQHVPALACALICGKYIRVPAGAFSKFDLPTMIGQLGGKLPVPTSELHVSVTTYAGQPAYELSGHGLRLYLAEHGTHYLLGIVDPAKFGTLNLSEWNSVPPISPPPASDIVHLG